MKHMNSHEVDYMIATLIVILRGLDIHCCLAHHVADIYPLQNSIRIYLAEK